MRDDHPALPWIGLIVIHASIFLFTIIIILAIMKVLPFLFDLMPETPPVKYYYSLEFMIIGFGHAGLASSIIVLVFLIIYYSCFSYVCLTDILGGTHEIKPNKKSN